MKNNIQEIEHYSKHELNHFFSKELPQKLKQHEFNLSNCFELWEKSKALGFIDSAEMILSYIVKTSIDEKRIWMLKKLKDKLGKKNQRDKLLIENALKDFTSTHSGKNLIYENIEIQKIVEREIIVKSHFVRWINSKKEKLSIDELKVIYLGILIHGVEQEVAHLLMKIAEKNNDHPALDKLMATFKISKTTPSTKKKTLVENSYYANVETRKIKFDEEDDQQKINLNFIEPEVLKKYLNDILFSLYCLRDYKNLYKIEELLELSFKKNPKEYQAYYFYKITALIDQKKFKQVQSFISNEIFNLPLTQKELLPFMYLMGEALIGLKRYEDALNFYMALQKDKQYELKALMRINEIKKN